MAKAKVQTEELKQMDLTNKVPKRFWKVSANFVFSSIYQKLKY